MDILWFAPGQRPVPVERPPAKEQPGFAWIDIERSELDWPTIGREWLCVPIDEQHIQDSLNGLHPPYYDGTASYDMLVMRASAPSSPTGEPSTVPVTLFLMPRTVISVRPAGEPLFAAPRERLLRAARRIPQDPPQLLYLLLDWVIDGLLERREPITELISEWQDRLLDRRQRFVEWEGLMTLRSWLRRLEATSEAQLDALAEFREHSAVEFDAALSVRFNDLAEHQQRVLQYAVVMQNDIDALVQIYFSATSQRTNEILRLLAVVSTIFLPLNLIAGIFGMNFEFLPFIHQAAGGWIAIGLMLTIASGLLIWFRHRGWI